MRIGINTFNAEELFVDNSFFKKRVNKHNTFRMHVGVVLSVGDGVARISGLQTVCAGEMVEFSCGIFGLAMNLEKGAVGVILFGRDTLVSQGDLVFRSGKILEVPVGMSLIGRVVNALGIPIDGLGDLKNDI